MAAPPQLHLMKLAVGCDSVEALAERQAPRTNAAGRFAHRTRMMPRRKDELLEGGSIYWVIRGRIQVRQALLDIVPVVESDGRKATHFILDARLVRTLPKARRAFQGWRYMAGPEAPPDLADGQALSGAQAMPADLLMELRALGLL